MSPSMRDHKLPIEVDHGSIVSTPKPDHHPLVLPAGVHVEGGVVPGPANIVPSIIIVMCFISIIIVIISPDCTVGGDIIVAGGYWHLMNIIYKCSLY